MEQVDGLLERDVLAGVVQAVEQDLRLGLVVVDVVADLGRPDLPALVGLADAEEADDVRMGILHGPDLRDHLAVCVIATVRRREVGGRDRHRSHGRSGDGRQRQAKGDAAQATHHGDTMKASISMRG